MLTSEARASSLLDLFHSDSYKYDPPPAWVGQDIALIKNLLRPHAAPQYQ